MEQMKCSPSPGRLIKSMSFGTWTPWGSDVCRNALQRLYSRSMRNTCVVTLATTGRYPIVTSELGVVVAASEPCLKLSLC